MIGKLGKEVKALKKILIVEDDQLLNRTLAYNLTSDGYEVISVFNFDSAVRKLRENEFDVALLDINLPDGSGLDLCEEIRNRGQHMQTLRHDERISDSKIYMQAANTQIENYLVIPVYIEQNNSQIVMDEIVEGQYPIDLYDVAVDKAYLEQLGLPVELGATITIPFYDGNTENFTVVGLTDSGSTERVYSLFCSKQYTEAGSQFQHSVTALAVQFAHADEMSKQVFEAMTKQIEADYGIPAQNSDPNDGFLSSLEPNWEDIQIVMIFSFAVLFVSYLVIYSIFYIYVHNQVREFGQLRTMGTTAKQIKKILRVQGRIFCVYGTALGLVIGGIAAFLFKPNGWSWGNTAITSIVIFLLVYGMIWLAMSKPAKIAGSISRSEERRVGKECRSRWSPYH